MAWILTLVPIFVVLWNHFRGQKKSEYFARASNYWIVFYVLGYFLPIPSFVAGDDGWTKYWGYSFSSFPQSLFNAVALATAGGLALSWAANSHRRPGTRRRLSNGTPPLAFPPQRMPHYRVKALRVLLTVVFSLGCLFAGVQLVGGLWTLLANLGDRINLFAGLNAFFLPVNLLIGVCFAISAARMLGQRISPWVEWGALTVTLPALFLLGQKSNIFILIVGITVIHLMPRRDVKLLWVALALVGLANLLLLYEFVFREALIVGVDHERLTLSGWSDYLWTQITGNLMQIQNLTVLVEAVPDIEPYSLGDTYVAFFSLIIPQSLMGIKPLTAAGLFTLAFWPEVVARESTTMPPGLFGEAYLNFGAFGYLVLCLCVGWILRFIDRPVTSGKTMNSLQVVSTAAFSSMALHFIRGEFFSPFLILVGILLGARMAVSRPSVGRSRHRVHLRSPAIDGAPMSRPSHA